MLCFEKYLSNIIINEFCIKLCAFRKKAKKGVAIPESVAKPVL